MIDKLSRPAAKFMGRLSHPLKFLVISALFILPLAVVMYLLVTETDEKIRFAQTERHGTRYLRPLRLLMEHLPEARLQEYLSGGRPSHEAAVARDKVDKDFELLHISYREDGKALDLDDDALELRQRWETLKKENASAAMDRDKQYIRLILSLKNLVTRTGNASHLILEPDLDTYYLTNALLLRSPENMDTLGQLRIIGRYVIEKKGVSAQGRAEFFRLNNITENNLYEMQKGVEFIRRPELEKKMQAQNEAVMRFLKSFDESLIRASEMPADAGPLDALCVTALAKSFELWDAAITEMDARLERRVFDLKTKKNLTRAFYLLALVAAGYFWLGFYRSVMNTISDLENAEKRMMSGDFGYLANPDTQDELRRIVYSFNNLAEKLRLEREQLIQAAKLESVGRLSAGIAHEVKNPLAVLLQGTEFLLMQPDMKKEPYPILLADMKSAVLRADNVIRGLLDFSAPKELTLKEEDLDKVINESLTLVRHELSKSNVRLAHFPASPAPQVRIDKNKMQQVFINLFTNACHAMPDGGTLTVKASLRNGAHAPQAVVEIDDTGSGIPQDKLSRIFDPFFTTKPAGKGTGLGLSVVRSIIEMHKGHIEVANRPSGGVRVSVTLPLG